jgi:hypothetical protein
MIIFSLSELHSSLCHNTPPLYLRLTFKVSRRSLNVSRTLASPDVNYFIAEFFTDAVDYFQDILFFLIGREEG